MADGTYERRGPREAELKRFARLIAAARTEAAPRPSSEAEASLRDTALQHFAKSVKLTP